MKLNYQQYCDFHASKCKVCKGQKRVEADGVWVTCSCQYSASVKWRFDQIQVFPEELKYKTWGDFTGIGSSDRLTSDSFVTAKEKALRYCFGSAEPNVVANRSQNSVIHKHLSDGQNVIISGPRRTGKSLIAILILKEVVYSCAIRNRKIDFSWIKLNEIVDAARWSSIDRQSAKSIDYVLLDHLSDVDFLFVDGVDLAPTVGNHRHPPDILSLDKLFSNRLVSKTPTIITCTDRFSTALFSTSGVNEVRIQYGDEFCNLLTHPNNVFIDLHKEAKRSG